MLQESEGLLDLYCGFNLFTLPDRDVSWNFSAGNVDRAVTHSHGNVTSIIRNTHPHADGDSLALLHISGHLSFLTRAALPGSEFTRCYSRARIYENTTQNASTFPRHFTHPC